MPPPDRSGGDGGGMTTAHPSVLHTALAATRCRPPQPSNNQTDSTAGSTATDHPRPTPQKPAENTLLTGPHSSGMPIPSTRRNGSFCSRSVDRGGRGLDHRRGQLSICAFRADLARDHHVSLGVVVRDAFIIDGLNIDGPILQALELPEPVSNDVRLYRPFVIGRPHAVVAREVPD